MRIGCRYVAQKVLLKQPPRQFSKISVLFFQEHLFLEFSRRLNVFTEQILIFQEGMSVRRTDTIFPGALFMCSPNRYRFSRSTVLATEQIPIFQEHLYSHRTDTNFPGSTFSEQITIFQEQTDTDFPGALLSNINEQIPIFQIYNRTDFPGSLFRISTNR